MTYKGKRKGLTAREAASAWADGVPAESIFDKTGKKAIPYDSATGAFFYEQYEPYSIELPKPEPTAVPDILELQRKAINESYLIVEVKCPGSLNGCNYGVGGWSVSDWMLVEHAIEQVRKGAPGWAVEVVEG